MSLEQLWQSMPDHYPAEDGPIPTTSMLEEETSAMQNNDSNPEGEPIVDSNSLEFVSYHNLESDQ